MNSTALSRAALPMAARAVLKALERLAHGRLQLTLPDGATLDFGPGGAAAHIDVRDWRAFHRILISGDIGFAEGWIDGDWTSSDPAGLLSLLARNRAALDGAIYGSWVGRVTHGLLHALRANTRRGARRNIAAHYDLGNDFYRLWLDPGMTYSSALFEGDATRGLEQAQTAKLERILQRLAAPAGSHVLEIGCGWGSFAERAARRGLRVSGITLSREQLAYARSRVAQAGLGHHVRLELRDYRDLHARYDAVVSIEMLEAVGERWWPTYFAKLAACLPRGGRALLQSIVIDDALFARYRQGSDFIRERIFPGGMLPSLPRMQAEAARAGLEVVETQAFGADYARTLALWRERFVAAQPRLRALGFDARFERMWMFYLAYCEAGFLAGSTDVVQVLLRRS
ncbi:MAG: cyclopropane-fatty-acyl-phospholipid synthase [Betaproteobacteria bacterium SG8_39]|nr:MAG: cyclopropane-fatty-acyl-phospholipid synthase [Betaproteobacteria bacterium SG8_39]